MTTDVVSTNHQGDFWLPSEFLAEEEEENFFLHHEKPRMVGGGSKDDDSSDFRFPNDFPYEYDSSSNRSSSPLDSVTETEREDDDYLYVTGLACRMAHTILHNGEGNTREPGPCDRPKLSVAASPQSSLCSAAARSNIPPGTGVRTKFEERRDEELELQRLRILSKRGLLGTPRNTCAPFNTAELCDPAYHRNTSLASHQQHRQLNLAKRRQQQQQSPVERENPQFRVKGGDAHGGIFSGSHHNSSGAGRLCGQSPHGDNGMRAIFLANPAASRKHTRSGTGVFLPRSAGCPTELRTKPACSTVLLPARVVQALHLNLDEMDPHRRVPNGFVVDQDTIRTCRNNNVRWMISQKKVHRTVPPQVHTSDHRDEVRLLPSEWTY